MKRIINILILTAIYSALVFTVISSSLNISESASSETATLAIEECETSDFTLSNLSDCNRNELIESIRGLKFLSAHNLTVELQHSKNQNGGTRRLQLPSSPTFGISYRKAYILNSYSEAKEQKFANSYYTLTLSKLRC